MYYSTLCSSIKYPLYLCLDEHMYIFDKVRPRIRFIGDSLARGLSLSTENTMNVLAEQQ